MKWMEMEEVLCQTVTVLFCNRTGSRARSKMRRNITEATSIILALRQGSVSIIPKHLQGKRMLVSRLGLISGFAFHAAEGRRICVSLRGTLGSSLPSAHQQTHACSKRSSVSMSTTHHQEQATKIVTGVRELCDKYDGFILDQFGVLHDGEVALPGAVECLEELRRKGKRLVILSNTSKREAFTMNRLPKFGFRTDLFDGGVTSGEEGYQYLARSGLVGGKALLLGWNGEDTDGFLEAMSLEYSSVREATFLLCHGPDTIVDDAGTARTGTRNSGSLEPYEAKFKVAVDRDLPMYNVNPDFSVNNPQGGHWYMPGLISKKYEEMGGRVHYFGKPHKEHFEAAAKKMGLEKDKVVHVGDSLAHDIYGAAAAGLDSVFIAGGISGEELGIDAKAERSPFELSPKALEKLFARESVTPTFTMPLFAL